MLIDVHGHVGAYKDVKVEGLWGEVTLKSLLEFMKSMTIDKAVVMPVESRDESFFMPTDYVLEVCNKLPERLIPFCNVDPRDGDAHQKIERYIDLGCKGFGEHKVKLPVDDPKSKEIYQICGKLDVPILLHIDKAYNIDAIAYERVVKEFSSTVFIAHGPGWWREISAEVDPNIDYPKDKVKAGGLADQMLQDYSNAYADLSAGSGYNALNRDREFAKGFIKRNYRKLLFGTDLVSLFDHTCNLVELLKDLNLNEVYYQAITHRNIESLLKLGN